jgi:hypothetical protein
VWLARIRFPALPIYEAIFMDILDVAREFSPFNAASGD